MSNFLNRLISRESGQATHFVVPRIPSRYEPLTQTAPFRVHEPELPNETWKARREKGVLHAPQHPRRVDEASTPEQGHSSGLTPILPERGTATRGRSSPPPIHMLEHEIPNFEQPDDPVAGGFQPIQEYQSAAPQEGMQAGDDLAQGTTGRVKPSVASARKGAMQAPKSAEKALGASTLEGVIEAVTSSKPDGKPLLEPANGRRESEQQEAAITIKNPGATPLATRQSGSATEREPGDSRAALSPARPRAVQAESQPIAPPPDKSVAAAKTDQNQWVVRANTHSNISANSSIVEQDRQQIRKPAAFAGEVVPQETARQRGQRGNGFVPTGSLRMPAPAVASSIASSRPYIRPTLSTRRESGPVSKAAQPEPTINVTIGRIEVRAFTQPPAPRRDIQGPKPMSLDEYLSKSSQRGR